MQLIEYGECECLYNQISIFVEKAKSQVESVTANVAEGMVHVYPLFTFAKLPAIEDGLDRIADFTRYVVPLSAEDYGATTTAGNDNIV